MNIKIEFYEDKTGCFQKGIYLKWGNEVWVKYETLTPIQIELIWDTIIHDKRAKKALMHLAQFPQLNNKKEILKVFIHCNWTKLDNQLDINGPKLIFENISCPFKSNGQCQYQGKGIVCIKHK